MLMAQSTDKGGINMLDTGTELYNRQKFETKKTFVYVGDGIDDTGCWGEKVGDIMVITSVDGHGDMWGAPDDQAWDCEGKNATFGDEDCLCMILKLEIEQGIFMEVV
jgi:hypothetical protein